MAPLPPELEAMGITVGLAAFYSMYQTQLAAGNWAAANHAIRQCMLTMQNARGAGRSRKGMETCCKRDSASGKEAAEAADAAVTGHACAGEGHTGYEKEIADAVNVVLPDGPADRKEIIKDILSDAVEDAINAGNVLTERGRKQYYDVKTGIEVIVNGSGPSTAYVPTDQQTGQKKQPNWVK